ncbi:MAG TPA: DUF3631 domain-containing protein [Candidatus Binatia bacterium]|nr:DUF3631 domain-containing protein [Candidatus Binatia bacterium]
MMGTHTRDTDPYKIDPLDYLALLNGDLSPVQQREHYQVLRLSLLRVQGEDLASFDLALKQVNKKLGIPPKTVKKDLAALAEPPASKEARELPEQMGQTRFLRLAQDFVDGRLWFGAIAGGDKILLNSDRELLTPDKLPAGLTVKDSGFDRCRLSKDGILHFLSGGTVAGAALLADVRHFFTRFAVFRDKRTPLLLAAWTLGTYRVFRVFPYLALRSPDKRCGKSRVLDILSLLTFNASSRVVHPTEAQIFRGPSRNGGTLLLDEVEALGKADKDTYAGLLAVLNSGFERGGSVSRLEKTGAGSFQEVSFDTFCPRAIAGISKTADTLEDRSIIIVMQRKLAREQTERFSPSRLEEEAQALRDRCYLWALTHAADLSAVYDQADQMFPALASLDDRARDLWEPLVSIMALADVERGDGQRALANELTGLASDLCQVRDGAADDSTVVQVVKALQEIIAHKRQAGLWQSRAEVTLTPTELAGLLKEKLGWEKLSTKGLASLLNPLGLYSKHTRDDTRGRRYHLSQEVLEEFTSRYTEQPREQEESVDEA